MEDFLMNDKQIQLGSCGGVAGRAVASENKDQQFESSHWLIYLLSTILNKRYRKDENKVKEAGNGPI